MKYKNIREEGLKLKVSEDWFWLYDCKDIIGNIDFCVKLKQSENNMFDTPALLWAEAKIGSSDLYKSIVQLILTIGKAKTFIDHLPPALLGAFDGEKIAFIAYNEIQDFFYLNDFNWNVTPSNYETKEFILLYEKVKSTISSRALLFNFINDERELKFFIRQNFIIGKYGITKIRVDKNNFIVIYNKWKNLVKPTIGVNWDIAKKAGIIDGDFYLADLLSYENKTLKDKLFVVLNKDHYILERQIDSTGLFSSKESTFKDNQEAHKEFWNKYERPPKEEYWDYIIERRDLIVPEDIRERRGSFFTPSKWVEVSQKYIAETLGENWQDEYYIWDCAAGTGNLLENLTNKYKIYASTLDKQDVEVIHDRIKNGFNLLENHVFQFDFLNDDFSKLPQSLREIIQNPEKRKKLLIYINPPYAEVASNGVKGKKSVNVSNVHTKYSSQIGTGGRELFILFLFRIYFEIKGAYIAEFSTLKLLLGSAFIKCRNIFHADLLNGFIVPADTFDNVKGQFPIGFKIWNTGSGNPFTYTLLDVYNSNGTFIGTKSIKAKSKTEFINHWISSFKPKAGNLQIGWLAGTNGNDVQNSNIVYILNNKSQMANPRGIGIDKSNLLVCCVYFSARKSITPTWLNDRDQFLVPSPLWKNDYEFQWDCFVYTVFNTVISYKHGINHWIPFQESDVNSREAFNSNFLFDIIKNGVPETLSTDLFHNSNNLMPLFSIEAETVMNKAKEIWKYYHVQTDIDVNASLFDIRAYFKNLENEKFESLNDELNKFLKILKDKIRFKVYEYRFLIS